MSEALPMEIVMAAAKTFEDGVVRFRDLDLGEWLGYERLWDVRKLIRRQKHIRELEAHGILSTVETIPDGAGRPGTEYWLNEQQCYRVCIWAETARADEVHRVIAEVMTAIRHGQLASIDGPSHALVKQVLTELRLMPEKVVDAMDARKRRDPSAQTRREVLTVLQSYNNCCPNCLVTVIVDENGNFIGEHDHTDGNANNNSPDNICPFCEQCHIEKTNCRNDRTRQVFEGVAHEFQRRRRLIIQSERQLVLAFEGELV